MGRSSTPSHRIEYTAKNFGGSTAVGWRTEYYGRPNAKNLANYCAKTNESFEPGGVNAHVSEMLGTTAKITGARIVSQRTGDVVATWTA